MATKNSKLIIIILCLLALAGGLFVVQGKLQRQGHQQSQDIYYCPMHPNYTSDRPGNCPICGMKLVKREVSGREASSPETSPQKTSSRKILYWTDPMIPGYKSDKPGKSPMNMDLIPVYEEEKNEARGAVASVAGHASVSLTVSKQQLMGVKLATVVKKPFVKTIRAYGYVAHDLELYEAQLEYIEAWREYYVFRRSRPVRDEFRADWREFYVRPSGRARSEDFRKAQYRLVKAEYELRHMGFGDKELEQLRYIRFGLPWVQPEILFVHKEYHLWVYAQVFEDDLGYVDVGQKTTVEIPAYRESYEGIVRNVSGQVDPATRTVTVRIEVPKAKEYLKVNMYANVLIPVELNDVVMVPRDAVMNTGMRQIVFVRRGEGHFDPVEIKTGMESDGMVEVKEGLTEGESVVASGNFLVDSESRLQAALLGMTTAEGHSHGQ